MSDLSDTLKRIGEAMVDMADRQAEVFGAVRKERELGKLFSELYKPTGWSPEYALMQARTAAASELSVRTGLDYGELYELLRMYSLKEVVDLADTAIMEARSLKECERRWRDSVE